MNPYYYNHDIEDEDKDEDKDEYKAYRNNIKKLKLLKENIESLNKSNVFYKKSFTDTEERLENSTKLSKRNIIILGNLKFKNEITLLNSERTYYYLKELILKKDLISAFKLWIRNIMISYYRENGYDFNIIRAFEESIYKYLIPLLILIITNILVILFFILKIKQTVN